MFLISALLPDAKMTMVPSARPLDRGHLVDGEVLGRPRHDAVHREEEATVGERDEAGAVAVGPRRHPLDALALPQVLDELLDLEATAELDAHLLLRGGDVVAQFLVLGHVPLPRRGCSPDQAALSVAR